MSSGGLAVPRPDGGWTVYVLQDSRVVDVTECPPACTCTCRASGVDTESPP